MSRKAPHRTTSALFIGSLVLSAALSVIAQPSAAPESAAPASASASAPQVAPPSASDSASAPNLPPLATHAGAPTPTPSREAWRTAPEVSPTRLGPRASGCRVQQLHEWLRVRCGGAPVAAIQHLGGDPKGVMFWIDPPKAGAAEQLPGAGEVIFALRPGGREVLSFMTFGQGYEGPFTQLPRVTLQAHWMGTAPYLSLF